MRRSVPLVILMAALPVMASPTYYPDECIGGKCKNGRIHSVTVSDDHFIVIIDPRSCRVPGQRCPGSYEQLTVKGEVAVRVEGYELGTRSDIQFTVYVSRRHKTLYFDGINRSARVASFDLRPYEVLARREAVPAASSAGAAAPVGPSINDNGKAVAVVLGIGSYRYVADRPDAVADADAVAGWIVDGLGVDPDNVLRLNDERATKGEMDRAFDQRGWLAERSSPDSDVIVYFSGHAMAGSRGDGPLLLPHDGDPAYSASAYPLEEALGNLSAAGVRSITVLAGVSLPRVGEFVARPPGDRAALPPNALVLLSVGTPGFTASLLEAISGGADADDDGRVTATEVQRFLGERLPSGSRTLLLGDPGRLALYESGQDAR